MSKLKVIINKDNVLLYRGSNKDFTVTDKFCISDALEIDNKMLRKGNLEIILKQ